MPGKIVLVEGPPDRIFFDFAQHYSSNQHDARSTQSRLQSSMHTVADDVAVLVLGHGAERGPFSKVLHVVVDIVIFRERVQIGQVHVKEIRGPHWTE